MKIEKVIFSCSEPPAYSSYWNIQSKLYRLGLGIEPICLLFGKISNTDMREDYGKVIEMPIVPDLPWQLQMTWAKFDFPSTEPETTWMTGDIDLVPLQKAYFTSRLSDFNSEAYLCLNGSAISRSRYGINDAFERFGSQRHAIDRGGGPGADLPAHYHVSKGKNFKRLFYPGINGRPGTHLETVRHMVQTNRYGLGPIGDSSRVPPGKPGHDPYWYYWCAEENYSSEHIWNAMKDKQLEYHGVGYDNNSERINGGWNPSRKDYDFPMERVKNKQIVDIHCYQARPYQVQAEAMDRIIELSGILK